MEFNGPRFKQLPDDRVEIISAQPIECGGNPLGSFTQLKNIMRSHIEEE